MTKKPRKTRKRYEDYGVSAFQIGKDWLSLVKSGEIGRLADEAALLRNACQEMHFQLSPKDGWERLARDLIVIEYQIPESMSDAAMSRTKMAKAYSNYADQLAAIAKEMNEISHQEDFMIAAFEAKSWEDDGDKAEYANLHNRVFDLVPPMKRFAHWLEATGKLQSHKLRPASERERRLVLACKLAAVFKNQFGIEPALKGGSAMLPIEDESPWAQFYQAAAWLIFGEWATKDRQGVLLEARLPTE